MNKILFIFMLCFNYNLKASDDNGLTSEEMETRKKELFQEFKQNKIDFITKQVEALSLKKECVSTAKSHNDIQECQKSLKRQMREVRKNNKVKTKDLRVKRRKVLQAQ